MSLTQFDGIDKKELSMIEVAHAILEEKGDVMDFPELLLAIQDFLDLSEDELNNKMPVFYTELNTDGSFISLGDNRWGLRSWYPIDSIDEEIASSLEEEDVPRRKKRKKSNAFVTSDDDVDYSDDDPEDMDVLDEEDDDEMDDIIDDEDETELEVYQSDLSELGADEDIPDDDAADEDLSIIDEDDEALEEE